MLAVFQELTGGGLALAVMAGLALAVVGVFIMVDNWLGGR